LSLKIFFKSYYRRPTTSANSPLLNLNANLVKANTEQTKPRNKMYAAKISNFNPNWLV